MSKLDRLVRSYRRHITVPWREVAAAQRVIFCVYDEGEERSLRANVDEFELATREAGHGWIAFDLTPTFARWLSSQRYARKYFEKPHLLATLLPRYQSWITERFRAFLEEARPGADDVVALTGVGSLFGLRKVRDVVEELAPLVPGRLLVFFPGSFEGNNYRLLDGYDGWNYLATTITADREP